MIILGIDPGTATTGYGLIEINNKKLSVVNYGLIETDKNHNTGRRLKNIHTEMRSIIKKYTPDVVAIEKIFFATNAKTAIGVGQAQGVMLLCAQQQNTDIYEYAPGTIKKAITGDGKADKKLIQKHIRKYLGGGVRSKIRQKTHFDNSADALAVAICHAINSNFINPLIT